MQKVRIKQTRSPTAPFTGDVTQGARGACSSFYYAVFSHRALSSNIWSPLACIGHISPCNTSEICSCSYWQLRCASPPLWGRIHSTACGSSASPAGTYSRRPSGTPSPPCHEILGSGFSRSNPENPPDKRAPSEGCYGTSARWLLCCLRCSRPSRASCPSPASLRGHISLSDSCRPLWIQQVASSRFGCCSCLILRDTCTLFSWWIWLPITTARVLNISWI